MAKQFDDLCKETENILSLIALRVTPRSTEFDKLTQVFVPAYGDAVAQHKHATTPDERKAAIAMLRELKTQSQATLDELSPKKQVLPAPVTPQQPSEPSSQPVTTLFNRVSTSRRDEMSPAAFAFAITIVPALLAFIAAVWVWATWMHGANAWAIAALCFAVITFILVVFAVAYTLRERHLARASTTMPEPGRKEESR